MGAKLAKVMPRSYSSEYYTPPSPSPYNYETPTTRGSAPYSSPYPSNQVLDNSKFQRRYSHIADNYSSLEQRFVLRDSGVRARRQGRSLRRRIVFRFATSYRAGLLSCISVITFATRPTLLVTEALAQAGLESSNLIVGIDFTKSNEWTGARSFKHQSLHHIGDSPNPYEQAISIIGRTLSVFDEDNLIPCFGFGDASTHDKEVFSFYPDDQPCNGFEEALRRYRELVPHLRLAGPTSFGPIIESAINIVEQSGGQYHVLLIIADGQVTRSVDTDHVRLSPQEEDTINSIVKASQYPLSIVLVGVGDGPWDMMRQFDDNIPARDFDNFQFVNFTEIMSRNIPSFKKEMGFALAALMEIPSQYKATLELQILGRRKGSAPGRIPLPPPIRNSGSAFSSSHYSRSSSFQHGGGVHDDGFAPPENSASNNQTCPLCLWSAKDLAFGCGHQTCYNCGKYLQNCPICRDEIKTRIKLY